MISKKNSLKILILVITMVFIAGLNRIFALEKKKYVDWHNGSGLYAGHSDIDWKGKFLDKYTINFLQHFNFDKARKYAKASTNPQEIVIQYKERKSLIFDASSVLDKNYSVKYALDGNPKSYWLSRRSNSSHWLMLNFGRKRLFDRLSIKLGTHEGRPTIKKYHIQFFYQGYWFDYMKVDLTSMPNLKNDFRYLGGIDASQIRIFIPENGTHDGYCAISEIELYLGKSLIMHLDRRLMNFALPVENGMLPDIDYLYPNAPRTYRGGVHAGVDITHYLDSTKNFQAIPLSTKTKILSAENGVIVRADHDYIPRTKNEFKEAARYSQKNSSTFVLRSFGGRQVWIDHENGVLTTYNHLSMILPSITPGLKIKKGEVIGYAGNSGLKSESFGTDEQIHLHFEIWVDGEFLGKDMPFKDIINLFGWMFTDF